MQKVISNVVSPPVYTALSMAFRCSMASRPRTSGSPPFISDAIDRGMCHTKSSVTIARPASELGPAWNQDSTSCLLSVTPSPYRSPSAGKSGSVTGRMLSKTGSEPAPFPTVVGPQLRHDPALDTWRREEPVRQIQLPYGRWCWVVTRHADVNVV